MCESSRKITIITKIKHFHYTYRYCIYAGNSGLLHMPDFIFQFAVIAARNNQNNSHSGKYIYIRRCCLVFRVYEDFISISNEIIATELGSLTPGLPELVLYSFRRLDSQYRLYVQYFVYVITLKCVACGRIAN